MSNINKVILGLLKAEPLSESICGLVETSDVVIRKAERSYRASPLRYNPKGFLRLLTLYRRSGRATRIGGLMWPHCPATGCEHITGRMCSLNSCYVEHNVTAGYCWPFRIRGRSHEICPGSASSSGDGGFMGVGSFFC